MAPTSSPPTGRIRLSLVIPAKDKNDPKLAELIRSIEAQDFPKDQMETLVITEGTSESSKAIGIRKAVGEVIGILASDNELTFNRFLSSIMDLFPVADAVWPEFYIYAKKDDALNRYFSLIGGNDPLAYYMNKNDRRSHMDGYEAAKVPFRQGNQRTIGDNGFFIKKDLIENTDLDNYYHIDNANEAIVGRRTASLMCGIWHKTGGNIFKFLGKRYHYGLQHAFNKNRRWHLVDFRQPQDIVRLAWFIFAGITLIPTLWLSMRGYLKVRDVAWFLHPVMCFLTVLVYAVLTGHVFLRRMFQSLFAPMAGQRA